MSGEAAGGWQASRVRRADLVPSLSALPAEVRKARLTAHLLYVECCAWLPDTISLYLSRLSSSIRPRVSAPDGQEACQIISVQ